LGIFPSSSMPRVGKTGLKPSFLTSLGGQNRLKLSHSSLPGWVKQAKTLILAFPGG